MTATEYGRPATTMFNRNDWSGFKDKSNKLRIISWNSQGAKPHIVWWCIKKLKPHIFCLQEMGDLNLFINNSENVVIWTVWRFTYNEQGVLCNQEKIQSDQLPNELRKIRKDSSPNVVYTLILSFSSGNLNDWFCLHYYPWWRESNKMSKEKEDKVTYLRCSSGIIFRTRPGKIEPLVPSLTNVEKEWTNIDSSNATVCQIKRKVLGTYFNPKELTLNSNLRNKFALYNIHAGGQDYIKDLFDKTYGRIPSNVIIIVAGDFNQVYNNMKALTVQLHPLFIGPSNYLPTRESNHLDYILFNGKVSGIDGGVDPVYHSDHRLIFADFDFHAL
jgi:hypothetical protein